MGAKQSKKKKDMAICLVVFNPVGARRIVMNYFYAKNQFDLQGWPVFTIELVYEGRTPELPDAFHVSSNSFMFHKENLYRVLERTIPAKYTKLAFIDCDVLFDDPSWYEKTSALLETHDVVQPFETAHWMDVTYRHVTLSRPSVVLSATSPKWDFQYHPGFAWCMRRDWYRKVGFFDWAVSGSGDTLSCIGWMRKTIPKQFQSLPMALRSQFKLFCEKDAPRMAYVEGMELYHLYHGSRTNRQYVDRHKLLDIPKDITDLLKTNKQGVFEWGNPTKWNTAFKAYFETRDDDGIDVDFLVQPTS